MGRYRGAGKSVNVPPDNVPRTPKLAFGGRVAEGLPVLT